MHAPFLDYWQTPHPLLDVKNTVGVHYGLVGKVGVEPTWDCSRRILSPLRLPFRHSPALHSAPREPKHAKLSLPEWVQLRQFGVCCDCRQAWFSSIMAVGPLTRWGR
jgi:hypothetical protein